MDACGIIAEYNPFHNGHQYQLEEAKRLSDAECLVVVMSGNFLQRGEPAIVDKWIRTEMALMNGADLVIELPVAFSCQSADYFAKGALNILDELSVEHLSFGSESGQGSDFLQAARIFVENDSQIISHIEQNGLSQETYASQVDQSIRELFPDFPLSLSEPNIQLGFAYAKQIVRNEYDLSLHVVSRKGAGYHDTHREDTSFQSATGIRQKMLANLDFESDVPQATYRLLTKEDFTTTWEDLWPLLQYQVTISTLEELSQIYLMETGLEYRFKEFILETKTFNQFVEKVKSKNNSWVKIQRICLYILLQIKEVEMKGELKKVKSLHVLGFSKVGQKFLSERKKDLSVPLITNLNQKNENFWQLDIRAGEIYRLANSIKIKKQDFTRKPLKFIDNHIYK